MSKIAVEYRPVRNTFGVFQHLYLVYTDNDGKEFTIGGHAVPAFGNPFSRLVITNGLSLQDSRARDFREDTDEARAERNHFVLDLDGRNTEIVWRQMSQQAEALSIANIPYDIDIFEESDNSNTTVASVLNAVGIDFQDLLPSLGLNNSDIPGSEDLFSEYADRLNVRLLGSNEADILYGGFGDDSLAGFSGDDKLSGYTPLLDSSDFDDANQNEVDILIGGDGADTFILGSEKERFYNDPDGSEVIPESSGNSFFVNPRSGIKPKSFALLSDFNPEEDTLQFKGPESFRDTFFNRDGTSEELDFPTYRSITVINSELISILNEQNLSQGFISSLNLSPESFSTAIIYDVGLNSTQSDFESWDVVAVIPANSPEALIPGVGLGEQNIYV